MNDSRLIPEGADPFRKVEDFDPTPEQLGQTQAIGPADEDPTLDLTEEEIEVMDEQVDRYKERGELIDKRIKLVEELMQITLRKFQIELELIKLKEQLG